MEFDFIPSSIETLLRAYGIRSITIMPERPLDVGTSTIYFTTGDQMLRWISFSFKSGAWCLCFWLSYRDDPERIIKLIENMARPSRLWAKREGHVLYVYLIAPKP